MSPVATSPASHGPLVIASDGELERMASTLDNDLAQAAPQAIIEASLRFAGEGRLAAVSSFGTESAALLKFVADVDASIPVIFLDTGWLFAETLAYRDMLTAHLGLRDVRTVSPDAASLAHDDAGDELWLSDPDACCRIRKVEPLARALKPFGAWLNGRKRFQGGDRAAIPVVEADGIHLKFNPLANVGAPELQALYRAAWLPPHPLLASGFTSVGCMPCTTRTKPGEDSRAGRWRDRGKTECGIHAARRS